LAGQTGARLVARLFFSTKAADDTSRPRALLHSLPIMNLVPDSLEALFEPSSALLPFDVDGSLR
jgi:hypothetical protein